MSIFHFHAHYIRVVQFVNPIFTFERMKKWGAYMRGNRVHVESEIKLSDLIFKGQSRFKWTTVEMHYYESFTMRALLCKLYYVSFTM